jgi:hypothetical protein
VGVEGWREGGWGEGVCKGIVGGRAWRVVVCWRGGCARCQGGRTRFVLQRHEGWVGGWVGGRAVEQLWVG